MRSDMLPPPISNTHSKFCLIQICGVITAISHLSAFSSQPMQVCERKLCAHKAFFSAISQKEVNNLYDACIKSTVMLCPNTERLCSRLLPHFAANRI